MRAVLVRYCLGPPGLPDPLLYMTPSFPLESNLSSTDGRPSLPHPINYLQRLNETQISLANDNPKEFLGPLFGIFEESFRRYVYLLRLHHQRWLMKSADLPTETAAIIDQNLLQTWQEGRCAIEDFEQITSMIKDLHNGHAESEQTKTLLGRHNRLIGKARTLEQHG